MKNIFKLLFVFIAAGALFVSCDKEDNYTMLTGDPDPNATYYVQFKNAQKSLETSVNNDGDLVNIETTISVALMGTPLTSDLVIPLTIDGSTTIDPSMYTLGSMTLTIPAGKTSASTTLVSKVEVMPIAEPMKLVLKLDAGANSATAGTTLTYEMFRIDYCFTVLEDLVGSWGGADAWDYVSEVTTWIDGDKFMINGIGFGWFQDWWGEVIVTNTPLVMDVNVVTGEFTIAEQDYLTATWNGSPQPAYGMSGSGKIDACNKVITLDYVFHQGGGTIDGTSWGPKFKEVITLK
jgi:hypothetical protein